MNNHHCKTLSIIISILALAGCSKTTDDSNATDSSNTETNTETHEEVYLDDIINELSNGFTATSLVTSGYNTLGFSSYYQDFGCTETAYEFTTYKTADTGAANKDTVSAKGYYMPLGSDLEKAYLTTAELSFDNEITQYYLTSNGSYLTWRNAGYFNPFVELSESDFTVDESDYKSFNLNVAVVDKEDLNAIATVFTGKIGYTLSTFKLLTDGITATGYEFTMEDMSSSYGTMKSYGEGTFTAKGDDVINGLNPIKDETISELDKAFEKYQTLSYKVDVTLPSRNMKVDVCSKGIRYDIYRKTGEKYGSYGYLQKGSSVQGFTTINDTIYEDGEAISSAYFTAVVPTFKISSVFFEEASESTTEKRIYKFKEEYKDVINADGGAFTVLSGSNAYSLTVTVEEDKLTFDNIADGIGEEIYVYHSWNEVKDFTVDAKEDCTGLTWSELLSNQPEDLKTLYSGTIAKEYLDLIPTPGGKHSYVSLTFNEKRKNLAQTVISIDDYNAGKKLIEDYAIIAEEAGFKRTDKDGSTIDSVFSKEVTVNGETKTVSAEFLLAASYFTNPNIVVYFSVK